MLLYYKKSKITAVLQQGRGPASPERLAFFSYMDISRVEQVQKLDCMTNITNIASLDFAYFRHREHMDQHKDEQTQRTEKTNRHREKLSFPGSEERTVGGVTHHLWCMAHPPLCI